MCLKSRHGPETLALSKLSRSASHPSRTEARECLEEAQDTEVRVPARHPRSAVFLKSFPLEVKTLMHLSSVLI